MVWKAAVANSEVNTVVNMVAVATEAAGTVAVEREKAWKVAVAVMKRMRRRSLCRWVAWRAGVVDAKEVVEPKGVEARHPR